MPLKVNKKLSFTKFVTSQYNLLISMAEKFIRIGAILAIFAVALGAFGAHGLKNSLSPEQLHTFEVGVRYHFYHTFGILLVALFLKQGSSKWLTIAGWTFLAGIFLFSGSLYLLSCRSLLGIESWTWLGPITPLGGLLFMVGWGSLFFAYAKRD